MGGTTMVIRLHFLAFLAASALFCPRILLAQEYIIIRLDPPSTNFSNFSSGIAVNNHGVVIGSGSAMYTTDIICIWSPGESIPNVHYFYGYNRTSPEGINDAGDLVGYGPVASGSNGFVNSIDLGPGKALDINNRGQVVGWNHDSLYRYQDGVFDFLPTSYWGSVASAINDSGVAVGSWITNCDLVDCYEEACMFVGDSLLLLGGLGGNTAQAADINNRGQVVGWSCIDADCLEYRGFIWKDGAWTVIGTLGGNGSGANAINEDAVVVGEAKNAANAQRAFIYDSVHGLRDLNDLIPPGSGWELISATDINEAGQITGVGRIDGLLRGFLLTTDFLRVTAPAADRLVIAGERDSIRWIAPGVDSVNISFTLDAGSSGAAYTTIVSGYPGSAGTYPWDVPDSLLSKKCAIRIEDASDNSLWDTSATFRIKGYVLARDSADQWEPFRFADDRWGFGNSAANLWPPAWWAQFNYQTGIDPFSPIQQTYPQSASRPFLTAGSSDFPDWPTFARAYGTPQAYTFISQLLGAFYRPSALALWASVKSTPWNGSCFGFSISALLAFDDSATYRNRYPAMPAFQTLQPVPLDTNIRKIINELFTHQFGGQHRRFRNAVVNTPPATTVQQIKQMLLSDVADHRSIGFLNNGAGGGGHSVVPYRAVRDTTIPGYWIYVYDNSYHTSDTARFRVDTSANGGLGSWTNNLWPGWGGTQWFYLRDPASTYLAPPTLSDIPFTRMTAGVPGGMTVVPTLNASVLITNGDGDSLGYVDSLVIDDHPGGHPFVPETGSMTPPYLYDLPDDAVEIRLDNFSDPLAGLSIFTDSAAFIYRRSDAGASQTDQIGFDGNLTISNNDPQDKAVSVQVMMVKGADEEKSYVVGSCVLDQGGWLRFERWDEDRLRLLNAGGQTTYDLSVDYVTASGHGEFHHPGILVEGGASHLIDPDWSDLGQPARIYIDNGSDGSFDDTIDVSTVLGAGDGGRRGIPSEHQLAQNYPNPFNPTTTIRFALATAAHVTLKVFDMLGREAAVLVDGPREPGYHSVEWDAGKLSGGVYYYRLQAGTFIQTKKLLLLR